MILTDKDYKDLAKIVKDKIGVDLGDNKQVMMTGRLRSVMTKYNFKSFDELKKNILDGHNECYNDVVDAITTNYTYFLREPSHFKYLREVVLPEIKDKNKVKDLRCWCAACSSGEEAYTIAMVIDEFLDLDKHNWDRKLLATDINVDVLKTSFNGVYSSNAVSTLPLGWLNSYFIRQDGSKYRVKDSLKSQVIFKKFNLMSPQFPFKRKFNFIFCRNVMIYFDEKTRETLVSKFYDMLEPGGYLFVGHSEAFNTKIRGFKCVAPSVYKKE